MVDPRTLQEFLKSAGFYTYAVDGIFGPRSYIATRAYLKANGVSTTGWPESRQYVALQQLFLKRTGVDSSLVVDGLAGAKTKAAIAKYDAQSSAPTADDLTPRPQMFPRQKDVPAFYGEVGKNQVYANSPYMLYGDYKRTIKVTKFQVHRKVKDGVERVLKRTLQYYGPDKIRRYNLDIFSGCFVVRKVRGGVGWSMHSWGIAIDWDAAHNELNETSKTAAFAQPRYQAFLDFWEDEGWISLGRERNYDWMHVQAARL